MISKESIEKIKADSRQKYPYAAVNSTEAAEETLNVARSSGYEKNRKLVYIAALIGILLFGAAVVTVTYFMVKKSSAPVPVSSNDDAHHHTSHQSKDIPDLTLPSDEEDLGRMLEEMGKELEDSMSEDEKKAISQIVDDVTEDVEILSSFVNNMMDNAEITEPRIDLDVSNSIMQQVAENLVTSNADNADEDGFFGQETMEKMLDTIGEQMTNDLMDFATSTAPAIENEEIPMAAAFRPKTQKKSKTPGFFQKTTVVESTKDGQVTTTEVNDNGHISKTKTTSKSKLSGFPDVGLSGLFDSFPSMFAEDERESQEMEMPEFGLIKSIFPTDLSEKLKMPSIPSLKFELPHFSVPSFFGDANDDEPMVVTFIMDDDDEGAKANKPNLTLYLPAFDCPQLPASSSQAIPDSVFELRPQDIRVTMALGDSITAGFGTLGKSKHLFHNLYENRGSSFSIGDGNIPKEFLHPNNTGVMHTIPTLLKHYAQVNEKPFLPVGVSRGEHVLELCYGKICPSQYRPSYDRLNSAMSGAMVGDIRKKELPYLFKQYNKLRMAGPRGSSELSKIYDDDWSMLTLLIGANDACLACDKSYEKVDLDHLADVYEHELQETLKQLKKNIGRLFVNVVELFKVSHVADLSFRDKRCTKIHERIPFECKCAFEEGERGIRARKQVDSLVDKYNERIVKIVTSMMAEKDPHFAVVVQPTFVDANISRLPLEMLSMLDCFHPSVYGHQMVALHMWNNMITPKKDKERGVKMNIPFKCPTKDTLLYTY